jgi:PAS domain S-box-containing protein
LVSLDIYSSYQTFRARARQAEQDVIRLAEAVGTGTLQFVTLAEDQLEGIAAVMSQSRLDPEKCRGTAMELRDVVGFLRGVTVVDASGAFVCSTLPLPSPDVTDVTDQRWFKVLAASQDFVFGPPQHGRLDAPWISVLAAPMFDDDGHFVGGVAGGIDLTRFDELLTGVTIPDQALATITDREGRILARSADADRHVGRRVPPETAPSRSVTDKLSLSGGSDLNGVERTWSRMALPNGWRVYVGLRNDVIFGPARASLVRSGLAGMAIIAVALGMGLLFHQRISRSLDHLTGATRAAGGGVPIELRADSPSEVVEVATQMNRTLDARSRAEDAERQAKEHFLSIFENAPFGICLSTTTGRLVDVNPALVKMLGHDSAEDLKTQGIALDPSGEQWCLSHIQGRDGTYEDLETAWRRKDGRVVDVRLNGRVVRRDSGPVIVTIAEDVTGERTLEAQLRQTQKMEAVGQLAGGVAHDFNNLLTVITGHARMMLDRDESDDHTEDVQQILLASERAASLTKQLLAFSRRHVSEPSVIDINDVVEQTREMLERVVGHDLAIEAELDAALDLVLADPAEVGQVVLNLVVNAREAMPDGGVIGIRTENRAVVPGAEAASGVPAPGQYVVLSVEDHGVGIEPHIRDRVFEPFFTTKPLGEGTGLGLSAVYGIVRQSGGGVILTSEVGIGSTFAALFPRARTRPRPSIRAAQPGGPLEDRTVLVVEDEDDVRNIVVRILARHGYGVLAAEDPAVALSVSRAHAGAIDLLITDMVMPIMNGVELADQLARERPDMPVLFMSGYTNGALAQARLEQDPGIFLAKPFGPGELLDRVAALVGPQPSDVASVAEAEGSSSRAATPETAVRTATEAMATS